MNFIALLIVFFTLQVSSLQSAAEGPEPIATSYEGITKVSPGFYKATIPGKPHLTFVMERITEENFEDWRQYAMQQARSNTSTIPGKKGVPSRADGSGHFKGVFKSISPSENEVWVAYITRQKDPQPNPVESYELTGEEDALKDTPGHNIEMFVTVTSHPQALITSHMGISITYENMVRHYSHDDTSATSISMYLHSLAAKVMLTENRERRYMVNTPTYEMERIIATFVSRIFIGTKEEAEAIKQRKANRLTWEEFNEQMNTEVDIEDQELERHRDKISDKLGEGKSKEALIKEQWDEYSRPVLFPMLMKSMEKAATRKGQKFDKDAYEAFLEKRPPLISKTYNAIRNPRGELIIYEGDFETPWLTIKPWTPGSPYNWMFAEVFLPMWTTHFVAVDLRELATCLDKKPEKAPEEQAAENKEEVVAE